MLCGVREIDVNEWRNSTIILGSLDKSNTLEWFWEIIGEMNNEEKAKLLEFSTGSRHVPLCGFLGLTNDEGQRCQFTLCGVEYVRGKYPYANTCSNRIDLPLYPTKEELVTALDFAIQVSLNWELMQDALKQGIYSL